MSWEYRVQMASTTGIDLHDTEVLNNLTRPGAFTPGERGWEIFHLQPLDNGKTRLFMKRPKPGSISGDDDDEAGE